MENIFNKVYRSMFGSTKNETIKKEGQDLSRHPNNYGATQRVKQSIKEWRDAIYEMENPSIKYRVKVQNIYKDTILNGQVKACVNKRKNNCLLQEFAFVDPNGEVNEDITKNIFQKKWFGDIMSYIFDAKLYGYQLINWTSIENGLPSNIQIINREFINPDQNILGTYPYSLSGLALNDPSVELWSLYCDTNSDFGISKCGYGLLYEVAMYEIMLRNLFGQNGDYAERFGQPTIIATTDKTDNTELDYLEESIAALGSSGQIIKGSMDQIEYLEYSAVSDGFNVYDNLEQRCEKKISKILLGHADALDSTPGKLGSSNGEESPAQIAMNEIQKIDSDYLLYYINDKLLPKLKSLGVKIPEGKIQFLNNSEKEKNEERKLEHNTKIVADIEKLSKAGFKVDAKWITETTGIPVVEIETTDTNQDNDMSYVNGLKKKVYTIIR